MNNRTEEKLKDISGMSKAVNELLHQAWERGYKYGLQKGDITEEQAIDKLHETGWLPRHDKEMTRPTEVNCYHCDYFKFSKQFIENVVKFMADYKIETVDDLMTELNRINEWLGGKDNE